LSEFEFYSIAASIVLALALSKLITSIPHVFARRRFDPVHGLFFTVSFLSCLYQWAATWSLSTHPDWSVADFVLLMAPAISLYLAIHVLISDAPEKVQSWREHFQSVPRWYFLAFATTWVFGRIRNYVFLDEQVVVLAYVYIAALLIGVVKPTRFVCASVGIVLLVLTLVGYWGLM
jgi:hypothetical protein